jgi:hypothetical protein
MPVLAPTMPQLDELPGDLLTESRSALCREDLEDYDVEGLSAEQLMHESITDQFRAIRE